MIDYTLHQGDVLANLAQMEANSVDCIVTSPPYFGLRDYGHAGQIGMESTPQEFVETMVRVFAECRRVLKPSGTCWVNLGDSYAANGGDHSAHNANQPNVGANRVHANGSGDKGNRRAPSGLKAKDLMGIPWRVALALQSDGWFLRQDIIWAKPNPMPESVRDRCTKAHEYIFLLTKSASYWYDAAAIAEPMTTPGIETVTAQTLEGAPARDVLPNAYRGSITGRKGGPGQDRRGNASNPNPEMRNARSVWSIATKPYPDAHFAVFPPDIPKRCILAGCPEGGTVLDPFAGSGTTLAVAVSLGRRAVGIELNPDYCRLIEDRMQGVTPSLFA